MKLIFFLHIVVIIIIIYFNTIDCLPQVRVQPQSAVILSSSEVRLKCESIDTPILSIAYWTHAGQRIEMNPSIIEMDGNELRIYQFGDTAYTQPGTYACVVSTGYGLLESEPAMLSLPTLDPFPLATSGNNVLNLTEGNIAVVPCELPKGNPRPIPVFSLDNNQIEIQLHSNRYKISSNGNLHIIDVKLSDSGKYQCSAKNPLTGEVVNNSQVTILQVMKKSLNIRERHPVFTVYKPPVASRVLVGDNYSIECVIAGWPKPVVEWEKYGDVLPERRSEVIHGTLHLYQIRLDDRGTYICRASTANGQSDIAYTALVEVLEPPKVVQRPDSLIQINDQESVSIKCGFRGRPEPAISWIYNGEELVINGLPATGGILSLNPPKEGIYQCIGRNPYGIAQANTALVLTKNEQRQETPIELPTKKSLIVFGPNNATVYEGETVQLHCLTQPGSTVQWLHNNQIINLNLMRRYEMLASGGLRIVSAQKSDSGSYECIASKNNADTSTAKCFVHVQGLGMNLPVSKLEIIDIQQIDTNTVKLFWKINETIENYLSSIQIQYRLTQPRTSWMASEEFYNRSVNYVTIDNLHPNQAYKFRLIGFDINGKQLVISAAKRFTLDIMKKQSNIPLIHITDAWITNNVQINLKWEILMNRTNSETVDDFIIYYRPTLSKMNYTTITIPNLRYPPINTYTITSIEPDQEYELRMATYSNRGLSPMSNSIEIFVPHPNLASTQRHPRINPVNPLPNLDEILENITKLQHSSHIKQQFVTSPPISSTQKTSDILYLTVGIIAGIFLILIIILIAMCLLRLLQRKKFLAHIKSVNGSGEYYCDGLRKNINPDYTTSPCLQHGVVSVDGKLIPFAYPAKTKSPKIYCHGLVHNSTIHENNTIHLNTNPMTHLENDTNQENFYHTLTPFSLHSQYEECPVHHRLINYSSDTLPFLNNHIKIDPSQPFPCGHHHTYQRQYVTKGIIVSSGNKDEQQPLNENLKHSTPPSTGSSHSSSGISSSMESPYNHWKYLVPLSVTTTTTTANETTNQTSAIIEPIPLRSS